MEEHNFGKGEFIIWEGEPSPGLFVVKSGSVKLFRSSPTMKEQIVSIVRPGECFECVSLFDHGPAPVSAQTLEASKLYFLPASDFDALLSTHPQVASTLASVLAGRLRSLVHMLGDFSTRKIYPRLAKLLYQLSEQHGEKLIVSASLPLNQQHLACMLGCSRQAVNSSLRRLAQEGIIKVEKRRIIVLKPQSLRTIK